jgi:pilus assembly protein CpaF
LEPPKPLAEIFEQDGRIFITGLDHGSLTFLNGKEIGPQQPAPVRDGDHIRIGSTGTEIDVVLPEVEYGKPETFAVPQPTPVVRGNELFDFKQRAQAELLERVNKRKSSFDGLSDVEFRGRVREILMTMLSEPSMAIPSGWKIDALLTELLNDFLGLGPIEEFLADDTVSEIMVNRPDQIYVERAGKLVLTGQRFLDEGQIAAVIQRIIQPLGRRIDESMPYVDARLADGSRVHAIIPPLALNGPKLTIRKFSRNRLTTDDLFRLGSLSQQMARFLEVMVRYRANILISGGSGSGKTTLLNVIANFIPDDQRIITVEDAAELSINKQHVISLESRAANAEGTGAVSIRELVRNTLRMRPDRVVIGECRGGEALDMLQAMNTGHDGSLATIHANSPPDTLARLETLVLMAGVDLPSRAIREQIASAINFVVQTARMPDGSRKITYITEIAGLEDNAIFTTQDIFDFRQQGVDAVGRTVGQFLPTGTIPKFVERLRARGIDIPMEVFVAG